MSEKLSTFTDVTIWNNLQGFINASHHQFLHRYALHIIRRLSSANIAEPILSSLCNCCAFNVILRRPGTICPRCQSSKTKYGEPKPCTICLLPMAYGSALVCQRCLHYRNKFGDPQQCQKCLQICAFYKDEVSRSKVDGKILCWVCTYDYKIAKSKERSDRSQSKRNSLDDAFMPRSSRDSSNMDSAYNEHLLTISQLQDDIKILKRKLAQKDAELLAKDRIIAGLKSDLDDCESQKRERAFKSERMAKEEINRLKDTIRNLQREKAELSSVRSSKKRRTGGLSGSPLTLSPLRVPPTKSAVMPTSVSTPSLRRAAAAVTKTADEGSPFRGSNASPTPPHSPEAPVHRGTREREEEAAVGTPGGPRPQSRTSTSSSLLGRVDEVSEGEDKQESSRRYGTATPSPPGSEGRSGSSLGRGDAADTSDEESGKAL
uniref:Protein FAM76A n=1 Tax=Mesocestoides corti TaxID=53468 RepID=A0A5K3EXU0_MESCO